MIARPVMMNPNQCTTVLPDCPAIRMAPIEWILNPTKCWATKTRMTVPFSLLYCVSHNNHTNHNHWFLNQHTCSQDTYVAEHLHAHHLRLHIKALHMQGLKESSRTRLCQQLHRHGSCETFQILLRPCEIR